MAKKRPPARNAPAPEKKVEAKAWRRHLPVLAGLWILAALAYANSFSAGLVYDNHAIIAQDSRIPSPDNPSGSDRFHNDPEMQ